MLSFGKGRLRRLAKAFAGLVGALLLAQLAPAGQERYDYDALGRLIRVIDEQNRVTEYVYDAAGNLRQVNAGSQTLQPLSISTVSPNVFRRGDVKSVTITGTNLTGASIVPVDPGFDIAGLQASASQIAFTLSVSQAAALGTNQLRVASAAGSASATITVAPPIPTLSVEPTPLAIPPDNIARSFTLRLSRSDAMDHTIALSASNANFVVTPASVTIPAGQTSAAASIKGVSAGQGSLLLDSATLGNTAVPIFITAEFAGISTSFAHPLGVVLEGGAPPAGGTQITPVASVPVGVVVGNYVGGVSPKTFALGSGPTMLTISGSGLEGAQSVSVVPNTGLTLGTLSVAPDGGSVAVHVTVAADAPISPRQVVVKNALGTAYPASRPDADRIQVVRAAPEVLSMDPLFGTPGTLVTLTLRGRNLQEALAVTVTPASGMAVDAMPQVNADGTLLTVKIAIAPTAAVGPYTVSVATPGGTSNGSANSATTFTVVNEIREAVTPIASPPLGVVVQDNTAPAAQALAAYAQPLGVAVGPVATGVSPTVGILGQSVNLSAQGTELQGVTAVEFVPAMGLAVGTPSVAADGKSVSVSVAIDPSAPQGLRTVRLLAGTAVIPFADPDSSLFRVSAPVAEFDSVTPNYLQTGQAALTLTVRGRNLQGASTVRLEPSADVVFYNPPTVNADGTLLTVNASAAATATPGPRALVVTTPGGDSALSLSAANTVTLTSGTGPTVTPVASPLLGVQLLDGGAPPPPTSVGPIVSPSLGVLVQDGAPPAAPSLMLAGAPLGVAIGPVATGIEPNGFVPGTTATLTVRGYALGAATGVSVNPATGITVDLPNIAPDGSTISLPITLAPDAPAVVREVIVSSASGKIPFADSTASRFKVGPGLPSFDSITPILAQQGDRITLTIRGANFLGATAVTATPAEGIQFSNTPVVNSAGTQITVDLQISSGAPLGARVIQVVVPGATSSAEPAPANTFTVYAP